MIKLLRFPIIFALVGIVAHASPPFAQEASDLKPEPAAHFGTLSNGLRYVVLANTEPKGRASLRLMVNTGSFNETDQQQGLAHFLEHLAFNGSTHYAPGTLVEFFQRNGMSFGGDTNAYTSYDQTVYQLELPDTKAETMGNALALFGDYANGLLLETASVDKERGIILSEKRTRDSADYRMSIAEQKFLLPHTLIPLRSPIGLADIIQHAPREQLKDYYDAWYRPENITVVIVGDFDATAIEAQLKDMLAPVAAHGAARIPVKLGEIPMTDGITTGFFAEPDAKAVKVSIETVVPFIPLPDTAANRLRYLARDLALQMLNRRLGILAKKEGAPFSSGHAEVSEDFRLFRATSIELTCQPEQWRDALATAEQELRRATTYGFEAAELQPVVSSFRNLLEQSVQTASTRRSPELADGLLGSIHDRQVFTSPAADLALYGPALERVTPEQCTEALRALWNESAGRSIFVAGNLTLPNPEKEIAAAFTASQAVAVTAPTKLSAVAFGYTDFGREGKVVKRTEVADLGITLVEFENGVRLNLKHTDFEANSIYLGLRVGTGQLSQPLSQPGLNVLAHAILQGGGLGRHSADDLQRILAGHTVGLDFQVGPDAFGFGGATNQADLQLQCQLLAAYLQDPGFRPEALRQAEKGFDQMFTELAHSVQGPLETEVRSRLAGGDPRFGLPRRAGLAALSIEDVKSWLVPQLIAGPLEIAIVGDLDVDATVAAVARTFGALPKREARPEMASARKVLFPSEPLKLDYRTETEIPKGLVALYWPATDASDVSRTRRLYLLTTIFSDRLRATIREKLGGAYSPSAGLVASDTFTGYGYIAASLTVDPPKAPAIAEAVQAIAADLQANGVTEDELLRARQPILTSLRESVRSNGYWLNNVLSKAQEKPAVLDWCRTRMADNEAITKAELDAYARIYFTSARLCRVTSLPEPPKKP